MAASSDALIAKVAREGAEAYRRAVAAQVEGDDPDSYWRAWESLTAALLLSSWASGAVATLRQAGVDLAAVQDPPVAAFARETPLDDVVAVFRGGPSREVVKRYIRLMPLTREKWEALIAHAQQAAREMATDEQANALAKIAERSPDLAALIRSAPAPEVAELPEEVQVRRTPAVQAAVQGTFFATGMTQQQVEQTRKLLAKVIRQDVTVSVAGKRLETLGVGDFVEQATLQTGTDLTSARLETVYRTNVNRAQTQGRLDIVRDETVQAFVPLMRFDATRDKRTRETHRLMDGYVATVAQIDSMGIATPLGFNCRCAWSPISIAKAIRAGFADEDGNIDYDAIKRHNGARQNLIDKGLVPDTGFISG